MTRPVQFTINPSVWREMKLAADQFDKGIIRGLRKRIKLITADGVEAVKRVLDEDTPGGVPPFSESARDEIKSSIRTQVLFGARTGGVRISIGASALPAEHQAILKAYNKPTFRHPVFGSSTWVVQTGRPYFGAALYGRREEMQVQIIAAVNDGLRAMGAVGI